MAREVVLSRKFESRLEDLTQLKEEVNGVLLYRPQGNYCPIESIFMTGKGNEGHVAADPKRMEVVNEFFRRNPEYDYIKFHTHSLGTIASNGEYFTTHFSEWDKISYDEQLKHHPGFIGMVITPKTKLLYAPDCPSLMIVAGFPYEANERIQRELTKIMENKCYGQVFEGRKYRS